MTNQHLINYHNEILKLEEAGSILVQLNRSKIKEFRRHNLDKIKTLQKKINDMYERFFVIEETPEGGKKIKMEGEGEDKKAVYLEGKTEKEFAEEYNALMNTPIVINF